MRNALLAAVLGGAFAAAAQPATSLRDRPSQLRPAATPDTTLAPAGASSDLRAVDGPQTSLRLAEVPPSRLAVTQAVLRELAVQQAPDQSLVVTLPADVLFDFDSATLRPDALASVDRAGELLRSYARAPVEIHGHTDAKGSDAYNDALSQRRAQAVAARLAPHAGGRDFRVQGFGERQPVAPNAGSDGADDPAGRQRNRRVEIILQPVR